MRREDIRLNLEYAETAPHAYGQEPRVDAVRVRFLTTNTNMRLVKTYEIHEILVTDDGTTSLTPVEIKREHLPVEEAVALDEDVTRFWRLEREHRRLEVGKQYRLVVPYDKGDVAAERWINGQWVPGMVKPASIHRTWKSHLKRDEENRRARHEAQVKRAPAAVKAHLIDLVEYARLVPGLDLGQLQMDLAMEWDRQEKVTKKPVPEDTDEA